MNSAFFIDCLEIVNDLDNLVKLVIDNEWACVSSFGGWLKGDRKFRA